MSSPSRQRRSANDMYFDLLAEYQEVKTVLIERNEVISQLRRELNVAKHKVAKLQSSEDRNRTPTFKPSMTRF